MLKSIFAAVMLALTVATSLSAKAEDTMTRTMTLTGHGEVRQRPDTARISMGVTVSAATASEALAKNSEQMRAVLASLKQAGIDDKDIQTSDFVVQPRLDYGNNNSQPPKTIGYDVINQVNIVVRDVANLGSVLDKAVQSGSNQISGISFSVMNPAAALDEARKLAVADALQKAQVYAAAAGVTLGPITSIAEAGSSPPNPVYMRGKMAADSAAPIAAGEQAIGMDVSITWEIK